MPNDYSFLMSVYKNDNPKFLSEALNSMVKQTIAPTQIVIVVDGPVSKEISNVLLSYKASYNSIKLYFRKKNFGLGKSLSFGVMKCSQKIILRMDSDDICELKRAEIQLNFFNTHPHCDLVGSYIKEFYNFSNKTKIKKVPLDMEQIVKYIRYSNPINHPSVAFKKEAIIRSGNYMHLSFNEDYFLWVRLIKHGFNLYNINVPLLNFRVNKDTYFRRGGISYFKNQVFIFKYLFKNKLSKLHQFIFAVILSFTFRFLVPPNIRMFITLKLLRSKNYE